MDNKLLNISGQSSKFMPRPLLDLLSKVRSFNLNALITKKTDEYISNHDIINDKKERSIKDYFQIGSLLILKKLMALILIIIIAVPFVYIYYARPSGSKLHSIPRFYFYSKALEKYSGKAIVLGGNSSVAYKGDILKGKCFGHGKVYNSRGSMVYTGNFKSNYYSGKGKLYENSEIKYKGNFRLNKFNGRGRLFYSKGIVHYDGEFRNGIFEGTGKEYYDDGSIKYKGLFHSGIYNGKGTLYKKTSGTVLYTGHFLNGYYDGTGKLYDANTANLLYNGEFRHNLFNGYGTLHDKGGRKLFSGTFINGNIDYSPFIGMSGADIKNNFLTEPQISTDNSHFCFTYKELGVTLVLDAPIDPNATAPAATDGTAVTAADTTNSTGSQIDYSASTVTKVILWKNQGVSGVDPNMSIGKMTGILGRSTYTGYSDIQFEDSIAINNLLASSPQKVLTMTSDKIYVVSFARYNCTLNAIFESPNGKFMYFTLSKSTSIMSSKG